MDRLSADNRELVISNICIALAILHKSVKDRKTREMLEQIKNEDEGERDGKYKGI
jgi:hypothetical protein